MVLQEVQVLAEVLVHQVHQVLMEAVEPLGQVVHQEVLVHQVQVEVQEHQELTEVRVVQV